MLAHDADVVVIGGMALVEYLPNPRRPLYAPSWRYCLRRSGGFRTLIAPQTGEGGEVQSPKSIITAGHYIAYADYTTGKYADFSQVILFDAQTQHSSMSDEKDFCASYPSLLLSRSGIAVWLVNGCDHSAEVQALSFRTGLSALDSGNSGELANLQLFQCAAGCALTESVVGWTHSGVQRYVGVG